MAQGIIIFGASGSGTSTIGRALAQELGFSHFETDNFSTVDTKAKSVRNGPDGAEIANASRRFSATGGTDFELFCYDIPFTVSRPLDERIKLLQSAIVGCNGFVISGSMWDWSEPFVPLFDLAVFVTAPTDVRVARLEERERERYGARVCEGGDMYNNSRKFIEFAKTYDTDNPDRSLRLHEEWIATLPCPVLRVDGTATVSENIARIVEQYNKQS